MKKLAIIVVIIALGGIAAVGGYSIEKEKLNTNININVNKQNSNNTSSVAVNGSSNNNNVSNAVTSNSNNNNNGNAAANNSNGTNSESSNNSIKNMNNNSVNNTYNQNTDNTKKTSSVNQEGHENISSQINKNNSSSSTSQRNSDNENKTSSSINVSDYMGVWSPVTEVQWDGAFSKNIIPTEKQLNDSKLIMTPEEFSFNGVTIKNPVYKIVPIEQCEIFGNARMGAYQGLNNNYTTTNNSEIGIAKTPYSPLYFIVAYPKGKSKEYLSGEGTFIFNYPYILDGHVFALVNTPEQPLYRFEK